MAKLRPCRLIIFIAIFLKVVFTDEQQFEFAFQLYKKNNYYHAIAEFERYLFFYPNGKKVDAAKFYSGLSYYKAGKKEEAIEVWEKSYQTMKDEIYRKNTLGFLFLTYLELNKTSAAQDLINSTNNGINFKTSQINLITMWINILNHDFKKAITQCDIIYSNTKSSLYYEIKMQLTKFKIKRKSPFLAGIFSFIPGGGYLYLNRPGDAAFIFIVNALLGYLVVDAVKNKNMFTTLLWGGIGTSWYIANFHGSINLASKYYEYNLRLFVEKLKSNYLISTLQQENIILFW